MKSLLLTSVAVACLGGRPSLAIENPVELAKSDLNEVPAFLPRISTDGAYNGRFVPHVYSTSPWGDGEKFELEVPEFIWANIEDDPHNNSPFFYGRAHRPLLEERHGWIVRFPTLEKPRWMRNGNALELRSELKGGHTVHFRIIPRKNLVEVQSGVTNGGHKPLRDVRFVNCAGANSAPSHFIQHPRYSKLYSNDEVISWDGAGQSLEWLDRFQREDGSFGSSIWFRAYLKEFAPENWEAMDKLQEGRKFFLDRFIDVPAIAKADEAFEKHLIVYSPQGREAFTNLNTPCFHGNTDIDVIRPGETRWTSTYYTFFEGDLARYFAELKKIYRSESAASRISLREDDRTAAVPRADPARGLPGVAGRAADALAFHECAGADRTGIRGGDAAAGARTAGARAGARLP